MKVARRTFHNVRPPQLLLFYRYADHTVKLVEINLEAVVAAKLVFFAVRQPFALDLRVDVLKRLGTFAAVREFRPCSGGKCPRYAALGNFIPRLI